MLHIKHLKAYIHRWVFSLESTSITCRNKLSLHKPCPHLVNVNKNEETSNPIELANQIFTRGRAVPLLWATCFESDTKCGTALMLSKTLAALGYLVLFKGFACEAKASHMTLPSEPKYVFIQYIFRAENWMFLWNVSVRDENRTWSQWFQDNMISGFTFWNSSRTLLEAKTQNRRGFYPNALK